jgi:hypothetical protein
MTDDSAPIVIDDSYAPMSATAPATNYWKGLAAVLFLAVICLVGFR